MINGNFQPEIFLDKKKAKKHPPKRKSQSRLVLDPCKKDLQIINDFQLLPMPTTLTCLVGFGLWRNGMIEEIVVEEKKGKKK